MRSAGSQRRSCQPDRRAEGQFAVRVVTEGGEDLDAGRQRAAGQHLRSGCATDVFETDGCETFSARAAAETDPLT